MTTPTASYKSHYQVQDRMRATGMVIIVCLLLSAASVDASGRFNGVTKRKDGLSYQCQVTYLGSSPRVRAWVGTYPTKALAALACDVAFYYIGNDKHSDVKFHLECSKDTIHHTCKPRSAYDNLHDWDERTSFIKAQVNTLMMSLTDFQWEDVVVPRSETVRQKAGDVAWNIVRHFGSQPARLGEFMAWLMHPSIEQRIVLEVHAQRASQVSQLCIHEADVMRPMEGEWFGKVHCVTALVEFLEARPGRNLWLALITGSLPVILFMFDRRSDAEEPECSRKRVAVAEEPGCNRKRVAIAEEPGCSRKRVDWNPEVEIMNGLVWLKLQALRNSYLDNMIELYGMLKTRCNQPMPPEQLQKLEQYKTVLHRMIPYLRVPLEQIPKGITLEKVDAFEKHIINIMTTFRRRQLLVYPEYAPHSFRSLNPIASVFEPYEKL